MTKTKIQKIIAGLGIAAIAATSTITGALNTYAAIQIGTGTVTGDASFDASIDWDETFTAGSANGSITDVIVTAKVLPTLNMTVSTGSIDLGDLVAGVEKSGSLDIEIGTNAANGVSITARSQNAGLTNKSDATIKIQDNQGGTFDDNVDESYTFAATAGAHDSNVAGFTQSSNVAALQVNNNTSEHTIYSTNKGEALNGVNDVQFTVAATAVAETVAGEYEDKITFTVTGNF